MPPRIGRPPGPHAKFRRIAERLRERIRAGGYPPGSVLPSIRTLAGKFRVGKRVVVLAVEELKRDGWIAATANRRLAVCEGAGRPPGDRVAAGVVLLILETNLERMVQVRVPEVLRGAAAGAGNLRAPLLLAHGPQHRNAMPGGFERLDLRGVVLYGAIHASAVRGYERLPVPVVFCDRPPEDFQVHAAAVDNVAAAADVTRRLLALGHRRFAFVRYLQYATRGVDPDALERQRGFELALREAGLGKKSYAVFNALRDEGPKAPFIRSLLSARPPVTAVLASDPRRAQNVIQAARAAGRRVPQDLSVAGFQERDTRMPEELSGPVIDLFALARCAALLLKHPKRPLVHERLPATWREGATIGPAPVKSPRRTS
ncbi:MAG: substrate-binding domain-containing protein [Planctomycetes bacterium]|nr:substrate-binding domain-containing protein [Planctomycetota bacterium]